MNIGCLDPPPWVCDELEKGTEWKEIAEMEGAGWQNTAENEDPDGRVGGTNREGDDQRSTEMTSKKTMRRQGEKREGSTETERREPKLPKMRGQMREEGQETTMMMRRMS